jgi:hypothetical protein
MLTRLLLVAEAVKAGIASKGGNATIYQCAIIQFFSTSFTNKHYSESLRLSPKTSLLLCTLLRSPTILSPPLIPSRNTTASSSESPRDMETCLPNSRYVISACCSRNRELKIQIQSLWDATGQLWATGALAGKYAGIFVSTAGLGGGQESTVIASISTLHCCGQNILHVTQMGCKTINFDRFRGNTANKGFCRVRIDLQNAVVILVLRFATLQNKLATAVKLRS